MMARRRRPPSARVDNTRSRAGFVTLVGLSGGLMALQLRASLLVVLVMTAVSLVLGYALLWYLSWMGR